MDLFKNVLLKDIKKTYVHNGKDEHLYFVSIFSVQNLDSIQHTECHMYCVDIDKLKLGSDLVHEHGMYLHDHYTYNDHQWKYLELNRNTVSK